MTGQLRPANLYNGRLKPIMPYAIRGVIWYQGETNADRAYQYREMFPLMIKNWRDDWGQGDFPFYWVQLADFMPEADSAGRQRLGRAARSADDDARQGAEHRTGRDHRPGRGRTTSIRRTSRTSAGGWRDWRSARPIDAKIPHDSPRYKSMYKQGDTILIRLRRRQRRAAHASTASRSPDLPSPARIENGSGPTRRSSATDESRSPQRRGPRSVRRPLCLGGQPGVQSDRLGRPAGDAVPHRPVAGRDGRQANDRASPVAAGSKTAAS